MLEAARQQAEPQRLLFVFLRASLPSDHNAGEQARFASGQGGVLEPVMCVDKTLDELGSFAELVNESEHMGQEWHIVLVASLSGRNGVAPTAEEAEKPLKTMMEAVQSGGDLSRFMAFTRRGEPVQFG